MNRRPLAIVFSVALGVRAIVALWARSTFPPAADGTFYDAFARRLSIGAGYTWLWPDGVVTPAAHYPVGYPALLAPLYWLFGAHAAVAMAFNALLGAMGVGALYLVLTRFTSPSRARIGALLVALHPALVPYTAAVMTEGVTLSLLLVGVGFATVPETRWVRVLGSGLVMGVATLVRPQCLLLAPVVGWVAAGVGGKRFAAAALVSVITVAVCLPWTARNCSQMDRCALVSVNGGWNLLIGTQTETGSWSELTVPEECKTVWSEAKKDACFESAARRAIAHDPIAWIRRAPRKIFTTLDYFGAAPWYLHQSNPTAFSERSKILLGTVETIVSRLLLLGAIAVSAKRIGPRGRMRIGLGVIAACLACTEHGSIAYLILAVNLLIGEVDPLSLVSAAVILETAALHGAFFGGGRYGLVVVPFVSALAVIDPKRSGALE